MMHAGEALFYVHFILFQTDRIHHLTKVEQLVRAKGKVSKYAGCRVFLVEQGFRPVRRLFRQASPSKQAKKFKAARSRQSSAAQRIEGTCAENPGRTPPANQQKWFGRFARE